MKKNVKTKLKIYIICKWKLLNEKTSCYIYETLKKVRKSTQIHKIKNKKLQQIQMSNIPFLKFPWKSYTQFLVVTFTNLFFIKSAAVFGTVREIGWYCSLQWTRWILATQSRSSSRYLKSWTKAINRRMLFSSSYSGM